MSHSTPLDKDLQANLLASDDTEMLETWEATHNRVDGVSAATRPAPRLVHESTPYISPYLPILTVIPYLILLHSVWKAWGTYVYVITHGFPSNVVANVRLAFLFCLSMAILLTVMPFFLLPRRLLLYSDARLVVYSTLTHFTFTDLRTAIRNSSYCDTVKRKRWDFATDLRHRVFIKRDSHRWEIMCSPVDPDAFVAAVDEACGGAGQV
jgi:hypothetical protein